jgi:hypothetical protein
MTSSPTSVASRPPHTFRSVFPVLALCWLAVFFDGMDVNIYGAVMPHMLDDSELGLTPPVPAASAAGRPSACSSVPSRREISPTGWADG